MILLQLVMITVCEVPPNHDIIVSVSGHAVMDGSDDETTLSTC
jgi:hypothetical protein